MRHLRPITAMLAMAAIIAACSAPAGTSGGESSQAPEASEPAATSAGGDGGGGGGGSGSGANGSITYEITGDATESGELFFTYIEGGISMFAEGGWVAYFYSDETPDVVIQINSNPASNIVNYGDGEILVVMTEDQGCTFNYSQNDASGLKGTIDCSTPLATTAAGDQIQVEFHATVDAHT